MTWSRKRESHITAALYVLGGVVLFWLVGQAKVSREYEREQERQEHEAAVNDGCKVIDVRQELTYIVRTGNYILPQYRTIETWSCPDGRRFER